MSRISKIKKILSSCKEELRKEFKVKEISIFGSFIKGRAKRKSDVDVLVDFEEGADLFDLVGLALYLEKKLGKKVDVVPKGALRKEIKSSVLREAVPL
jgi:predicted nucleotidyltransferase